MIGAFARFLFMLVVLVVCVGAALLVYSALGTGFVSGRLLPNGWDSPVSSTPRPPQTFSVRPGQSATSIGEELQQRGVIRSAIAFRWEVENRGVGSRIEAGDYELSPSMSTGQVVEALSRPPVAHGITLTIPEGWRAEQVALRIAELNLGKVEDILHLVRSPRESGLSPPDPSAADLEGFLFPETYQFDPKASPRDVVEAMTRQFDQRLGESLRRQAAARGLTLAEVVTLASIIEREAAQPAERPLIASVYSNRLAAGMKLDADPTVQYAIASLDLNAALAYGLWKQQLTLDDLKVDSPYNTYLRPGLPPGPICSPGAASLEAAVAPANTGHLYFVARGDGSHAFADTLQQHLENVNKYQ